MNKFLSKLKKHKNLIIEIIIIALISLFSFSIAPKTLQNDTYYTVSIGNLILENGIDMKDHFSWHENLDYTYPHWLYDVIMSLIYNVGEWDAIYISVCIMSIILGLLIYIVNKKLNKNQIISFCLSIGAMYLLKDYIAARAQLVTFIIYVIVAFCIEKFLENPKKIIYPIGIIISSILIANLHSAVWPFLFIISLPYIAEYFISIIADIIILQKIEIMWKKFKIKIGKGNSEKLTKDLEQIYKTNEKIQKARQAEEPYKITIKRNPNVKWLILVMLICGLTGFLTPLGNTPYVYLIKTIQGNTTSNINEHLPLTLAQNVPIMCTIVIILALLTFTKAKIKLSDLFMLGGLTYLMFISKRQSTMFVIFGTIILNRILMNAIEIYNDENMKTVFPKLIAIAGIMVSCIAVFYGFKYTKQKKDDDFVDSKTYPVEAANWILKNLDVNNIRIYNEYNYGSYLLYKGIPVFIDSRADLYAPEFNGEKDIFMDFINTSNIGTYYGNTFKNYDMTHIIVYKNAKIRMLIDETEPENYDKIYSDDNFVIYEVLND